MKQILFRGKTESGRWAYGSLILAESYCCILEREEDTHPCDYVYLDKDIGTIDGCATPVIPETVGMLLEYPCYNEDPDQKIFEGDILSITGRCFKIQDYSKYEPAIAIDNSCITVNGFGKRFPQDTIQVKVIGNVHDNPELVGEKAANMYKHYHCLEVNND